MEHLPYVAAAILGASMFFALLSNSLRRYSIIALEEQFAAAGRQKDLERFLADEESLVAAASVYRVLANVTFGLLLAIYLSSRSGVLPVLVTVVLAAAALLVFGVAVPLAWARYSAEPIIVRTLPVLLAMRLLSWPLLAFLGLFHGLVRRLAGAADGEDREERIESELLSVVKEGEIEGAFKEDETEMLESIIELRDTDVSAIMTPRTEMVCVPHDALLAAVRQLIFEHGHSRVPAYQTNLDTIVGVLYAKDLLAATAGEDFPEKTVADIMRSALFIPESKKLTELLHDFQQSGVHIAIVLDEYGGTAGLVTIEDVIEEIVGEIPDEYDQSEPEEIRRLSESTAEVDAQTRVDEVNDELDIELPEEEDYETIGGFVFSNLGYIPKAGEKLDYRGLAITVLEADERRIRRLRIDGLDRFARAEE